MKRITVQSVQHFVLFLVVIAAWAYVVALWAAPLKANANDSYSSKSRSYERSYEYEKYQRPVEADADAAVLIEDLIYQIRAADDETKIRWVNSFFSQLRILPENSTTADVKQWATPEQLMMAGGGNSKDFALAKFFVLEESGFPTEQLQIVHTSNGGLSGEHYVLLAYPNNDIEALVMDNLIRNPMSLSERTDLFVRSTIPHKEIKKKLHTSRLNVEGVTNFWVKPPKGNGINIVKNSHSNKG